MSEEKNFCLECGYCSCICNPSKSVPKEDFCSINHPSHYTSHPSGVECITVTQHFSFNIGNAVKYLWRAGLKGDAVEDLKKAVKYIEFELKRIV